MSIDNLPQVVMGRTRSDLELATIRPASAEVFRKRASATVPQFHRAFGGDGITMEYGWYASKEIILTAVNGQLTAPLTVSAGSVEHSNGMGGPLEPISVDGSATTICTYALTDFVALNGQPADLAMAQLLRAAPAAGILTCTRRDPLRNFSVQLSGTSVSTDSPSAAAAEMATAVDQAWMELVK